jgi:hypothetical protein
VGRTLHLAQGQGLVPGEIARPVNALGGDGVKEVSDFDDFSNGLLCWA